MWKKLVFNPDTGTLLLRLALGSLLLIHGIHKLLSLHSTAGWIAADLLAHHLPGFFAYGVLVGEVVAPLLILLGLWTRIGGLLVVINIIFAIVLVRHGPAVFLTFNSPFGGWTLQPEAFFCLTGLSLIFLGGGKYAVLRPRSQEVSSLDARPRGDRLETLSAFVVRDKDAEATNSTATSMPSMQRRSHHREGRAHREQ